MNLCMLLAISSWLLGFELSTANLLREVKCGSMGLSHEAFVGVKMSLTRCFLAYSRTRVTVWAEALSRITYSKTRMG